MTKRIWILVAVLAAAPPGLGALSVSYTAGLLITSANPSRTLSSVSLNAGDLVVVGATTNKSQANMVLTITSTLPDSLTHLSTDDFSPGANPTQWLSYTLVTTSGSYDFTATASAASTSNWGVWVISGSNLEVVATAGTAGGVANGATEGFSNSYSWGGLSYDEVALIELSGSNNATLTSDTVTGNVLGVETAFDINQVNTNSGTASRLGDSVIAGAQIAITNHYEAFGTGSPGNASANGFYGALGLAVVEGDPRTRLLPTGNYNVLFISIDDLRPLIGVYGETEPLSPITPEMDAFAATAVSFSNAHAQQPICNASRASLMTGLRPDSTFCWNLGTFFRDTIGYSHKTLPQHFGDQGYSTWATGKIYHGINAFKQDDSPTGSRSWTDGWVDAQGSQDWYERPSGSATDAGNVAYNAYDDGVATDEAVSQLATYAAAYQGSGTPFFLAVGLKKPHLPFNAPLAYWNLYDPDDIDLTGYTAIHDMPDKTNDFTAPFSSEPGSYSDITYDSGTDGPNATDSRRLIHGYLACASYVDALVGMLLDALEDPDGNPGTTDSIADDTIVVIWSDHGFFLGEHNGFWAKHSNYDISTRVPLMIRAPGMDTLGAAGQFCPSPVELVDLYPTLVDLCSLPDPVQPTGQELQGTTFLPLLEDPRQPWKKAAYTQYQRFIQKKASVPGDVVLEDSPGSGMGYSIRTDRYRYTEWWYTSGDYSSSNTNPQASDVEVQTTGPSHRELYDYVTDPGETVNLAYSDLLGTLNPAYTTLMAELSGLLNDSDTTYAGDGWRQSSAQPPAAYPVDVAAWKAAYDTPGLGATDLDLPQDPDGDNWINAFEYKFGTHPLDPDDPGLANATVSGNLTLTFPEVVERTDSPLDPEQSSDLSTWDNAGISMQDIGVIGNATRRKASTAIGSEKVFLRLSTEGSGAAAIAVEPSTSSGRFLRSGNRAQKK
jgi:iduronate 2-sulfatase